MDDVELINPAELERLAVGADPDADIAEDALPFLADASRGCRPPARVVHAGTADLKPARARMFGAAAFVGALVIVNGAGLCVTYGLPEIAW